MSMTNPAASPSHKASRSPRPLAKISLKWSMIEEDGLSVLEKFQLLRDLGFDGVELDSPNDLPSREVLDARDKTGVAIPGLVNSMHWKTPLTDADPAVRQACVDSMITALDDAKLYGADTVLLVPGVVRNSPTSYKTAYSRALEEIPRSSLTPKRRVCRSRSRTCGTTFCSARWKPPASSTPATIRRSAGISMSAMCCDGRPTDWIEALGHRILKIDVKEYSLDKMNSEGPWKGFEVEIGDGDCDWAAVNRALAEVGYCGWASVEVPGGDRHRLAAIKERVDRISALMAPA